MNYFISDLHLGHKNIIKLCSRPYSSLEEMDAALINNWNSRVNKSDTVYIVGDFIWQSCNPEAYLPKLKGKKILITGNHDVKWLNKGDYSPYFELIAPYLEAKVNGLTVTFCHYPMAEWNASRKMGSKKLGFHIHGHIHNGYNENYKFLFKAPHALNAGADINGFTPVTFEELVKNNEAYKLSRLPSLEDKAEFLAAKYHMYQTDKAGRAYIEHPKSVAAKVEGETYKTVALLHDVLEDTDIDAGLLKSVFPDEIVQAVIALTHREGEDYFDFIRRVKSNPVAARVKLADLAHNSDLSRLRTVTEYDLARNEKYKRATEILKETP